MLFKDDYIAHCREDKKIQSLDTHLKSVSIITGELASKVGLKEPGEIIGLLHDIGKASRDFQQYIKSATGLITHIPHSREGSFWNFTFKLKQTNKRYYRYI